MQVKSLGPAAQAGFETAAAIDRAVALEELNPMILFVAPDRFAQRVWTHFTQQDDPCGFVRRLVAGEGVLGHGVFDP